LLLLLLSLLLTLPAIAGKTLTPTELSRQLQAAHSPQVLDVRTADEFARGHVPGALLIPHDALAAQLDRLDPARPVVVYCRSGRRATIVETLLRESGFDVSQLQGSFPAWREAGLPVACPEAGCPADFEKTSR
jgi:rhodanese-related sulfurtransferase